MARHQAEAKLFTMCCKANNQIISFCVYYTYKGPVYRSNGIPHKQLMVFSKLWEFLHCNQFGSQVNSPRAVKAPLYPLAVAQ